MTTPRTVPSDWIAKASLEQLQQLADQVGIGYAGLSEKGLRQRIVLEGQPHS